MQVTIDKDALRKLVLDLPKTDPVRMNYLANQAVANWWAQEHSFTYQPTISAGVALKR